MNWLVRGLRTSVGTKFLMATTGLLLLGFVIAHMLGNLQVYAGPEQLNAYAETMQSLGPILWIMRAGLAVILLVHIRCALKLTRLAREARPVTYAAARPIQSTYQSRTMLMSGLIILAFIVFHLLHFTTGNIHSELYTEAHAKAQFDLYSMFVRSFQDPATAIAYVIAMLLLGNHLAHGVSSLCQSMGWVRPKYREFIRKLGLAVPGVIVVGNVSMPLACWFGLITLEVSS